MAQIQQPVVQQEEASRPIELEQEPLHRRVESHAVSMEKGPYEQSPRGKGVTSHDGNLNDKKQSAAETMATTMGGPQSEEQFHANTVQNNSQL